ncbi:MAG: hypothetical protein ABSF31_06695 [Steroidobacteraceae bacterium]
MSASLQHGHAQLRRRPAEQHDQGRQCYECRDYIGTTQPAFEHMTHQQRR